MTAASAESLASGIEAVIGRPLGATELLAVAVSGGPDSLALMALAHAAFGGRVRPLTVDHGLRPENAAEAEHVARISASLGLPHVTLRWSGAPPARNLQAAARSARYSLLRDWCSANGVAWLATAHHRDDAAETLLLRLARGAGAGGLGGIRARRPLGAGVTALRPLLGVAKATLAAVVAARGWTAVDDPSNRSPRFDRTRARAVLAATRWLDPARLAASSCHLADAEAALAWAADAAWRSRAETAGSTTLIDAAGLPHDLKRRLVVRAVAAISPDAAPRGAAVEHVLRRLAHGEGAVLAGVAFARAEHHGTSLWAVRPARPRRMATRPDQNRC